MGNDQSDAEVQRDDTVRQINAAVTKDGIVVLTSDEEKEVGLYNPETDATEYIEVEDRPIRRISESEAVAINQQLDKEFDDAE